MAPWAGASRPDSGGIEEPVCFRPRPCENSVGVRTDRKSTSQIAPGARISIWGGDDHRSKSHAQHYCRHDSGLHLALELHGRTNGDVALCCVRPAVGNTRSSTIDNIRSNAASRALRADLIAGTADGVCRGCLLAPLTTTEALRVRILQARRASGCHGSQTEARLISAAADAPAGRPPSPPLTCSSATRQAPCRE